MTRVDLDGVTFTCDLKGDEYSVRKHDIEATEFYVDRMEGGVSIAPENHDGPTDYAAVELPSDAAETLANKILETIDDEEQDDE